MRYRRTAYALVITPLLIVALVAANYVAGVFLFLLYRHSPDGATRATMLQAVRTYESRDARQKIVVSALGGLALCVGGPLFLVLTALRQPDRGLYGRARFASRKDIQAEGLYAQKGILLGRHAGEFLKLPGSEFVLLAAPTRTGKGVSFVVPNLLTYEDSVVVLDIKGENYLLTSAFRQQHLGAEVVYFNPFSEQSHRWNPLAYIPSDPKFRVTGLFALAADLYPSNPKDPFWSESARNLFVGLALLVLETPALPQTIGEILRQGSGKGQPLEDYLRHVIAVRSDSEIPLSGTCIDFLNRFLNNSESVLKNVLSSFVAPLAIWGNPVIDKATSGNDFNLGDLRKKKMAVYVHVPASELKQAGFILNLFFSQVISENVRHLPQDNPAVKHKCLLLLDECTAIGKVDILARGIGYMAGYNLRLAIVIQDKTQLESVYGKPDAHNILSNMGAVVYFTPSDVRDAEEYSKMIGYDTVRGGSLQYSNVGIMNQRSSRAETQTYHSRALMLPQELREMPKHRELIVRGGIPVIQADKISYFSEAYFLERFGAVPSRKTIIDGKECLLPFPAPLLPAKWEQYEAALSTSDHYCQPTLSRPPAGERCPTHESDSSEPPEVDPTVSKQQDPVTSASFRRKAREFLDQLAQDKQQIAADSRDRDLL